MVVFGLRSTFFELCLSSFSSDLFSFGPGCLLLLFPLIEDLCARSAGDVVEDCGLEAAPEPGFFNKHGEQRQLLVCALSVRADISELNRAKLNGLLDDGEYWVRLSRLNWLPAVAVEG